MSLAACEQSGSARVSEGTALAPASVAVRAEPSTPIRILSGQLTVGGPGLPGVLDLKGTAGFDLFARVSMASGVFQPYVQCTGTQCVPGFNVPLDAHWSDSDLASTVTLRGKTYVTRVGPPQSPYAAVDFKGSIVLPPLTDADTVEVSGPFTFTGFFRHFPGGAEMVTETLTGQGIGRVSFAKGPDGAAWVFTGAVYEFNAANR